ncbi:ATP-binding cassette domain-containing protein [bacterium]|nr:ATP-binding cassette domain-containing protein [bacterium]
MTLLTLTNIHKQYAAAAVLSAVDLAVEDGEIVCLLGPSGCGKTTLLRIVAGLEQADQGDLRIDGEDLTLIPVHRRRFGLMFQEFALFPHMTVADNIAFGLRMAGADRATITRRVDEMLALVDLDGYGDRSVFALSGGERQRVALARSLAPNPRLLMLDEPLGSLDRTLREELMTELRRILKRVGVTALYVTHDQQESFAVADRVVVMNAGRIEQIGAPQQVYARPATSFVARFLGLTNLIEGEIHAGELSTVQTKLGMFHLAQPSSRGTHTLLIRPEIELANLGQDASGGSIRGTLTAVSFRGSDYHVDVAVEDSGSNVHVLDFILPTRHRGQLRLPDVGERIQLGIDAEQLVLL